MTWLENLKTLWLKQKRIKVLTGNSDMIIKLIWLESHHTPRKGNYHGR